MSVEYIKRLAGPFIGDGSGQKVFTFGFLIFDEGDVSVSVADEENALPRTLTRGEDFSVQMNEDQAAAPGGTITLLSDGLAKGAVLAIGSSVPYTQTLTLTNYTRFPPERITKELDRIVVQIQQIKSATDRSVKTEETDTMTWQELRNALFSVKDQSEESAQRAADSEASATNSAATSKSYADMVMGFKDAIIAAKDNEDALRAIYANIDAILAAPDLTEEDRQACEEIKQNIFQYSWDIPHVVETLRDVENYPYDGMFAVKGFGNPGQHGEDISNRVVRAEGSTELRTLVDRFADVVNVRDFGAKGDGVTDDTDAIQMAADEAVGKSLYIPSGRYLLSSSSVRLPSNIHVFGDGAGSCLIQPNYYSYTGTWDRAEAVDWNVFQLQPGTENVIIEKLSLRGPFASSDYSANPVQNFPYSNGILCRGRDFQDRKGLEAEGESRNIRIDKVSIEGFAEDAIQLDNVTDGWVTNCDIKRCGRGGVRVYGGVRIYVAFNSISYLSPGDKLNNGNRMYGVTFTRIYKAPISLFRPSQYCSAAFNKVSHSPYWKGLDTHGGVNIDFSFNQIEECHIGIGVDKGGFTEAHGFAPPSNIKIVGNTIIRTMPDDPNEGDGPSDAQYAYAGAGLSIFAHDSTDDHIGKNVIVADNFLYGWGENIRHGAVVYSNWLNVCHTGNVIKNSRRTAVCLVGVVEGNFSGGVIDDVRPSSLGVQTGIDCSSTTVNGVVSGMTFINRQGTNMTAVSLTSPSAGFSFKVGLDLKFQKKGDGDITKVFRAFIEDGLWSLRNLAAGYVRNTGAISAGRGISSVVKTDTGTYEITTQESATAATSLWPSVTPIKATQALIAQAQSSDVNKIVVTIKDSSGVAKDASFYIQVVGY